MKRINNRPVAVEAVLTRRGTVVGPFMSELTGHAELTPYRGGWCGNEMFPEVLTETCGAARRRLVRRLGDRLGREGYRGFFEVDVLVDIDTDEVYLGELNPRISGASAITNVTAGAYADMPLFLFHLLEYMDVEYELDVDEINERWGELASVDLWTQMIIKETSPVVEQLITAAPTGQYSLDDGALVFRRAALDWHQLQNESEASSCGSTAPGDYRWKGADLGVLVTKGRLQQRAGGDAATLTIRAKRLIDAVRGSTRRSAPPSRASPQGIARHAGPRARRDGDRGRVAVIGRRSGAASRPRSPWTTGRRRPARAGPSSTSRTCSRPRRSRGARARRPLPGRVEPDGELAGAGTPDGTSGRWPR